MILGGDEAHPVGHAPGPHGVQVRRRRTGQGSTVSLFVDGTKDGEGRIDMTIPMVFSGDETCDVGKEGGSPVSPVYGLRGDEFKWHGQLGPD
jgi:hypothetical protein